LNPIKRKSIVELTAKDLNLSADIVDDIVSHYYLTLQRKLSSVEHPYIAVPRLGTFVVKKKSLVEMITKHQNFVNKIEKDEHITVHTYELIIKKRADIEQLTKLQERMNQELERKEEVKLKKQIYQDGKLD
jgi:nucleoid DNA-binding protein